MGNSIIDDIKYQLQHGSVAVKIIMLKNIHLIQRGIFMLLLTLK